MGIQEGTASLEFSLLQFASFQEYYYSQLLDRETEEWVIYKVIQYKREKNRVKKNQAASAWVLVAHTCNPSYLGE
jgi:hypothetical protein